MLSGLLLLWISFMIQTVNLLHQASSDKEETLHGLEIPIFSRMFYFIGDLMYVSGGALLLFRFKVGMYESVKLTWSVLFDSPSRRTFRSLYATGSLDSPTPHGGLLDNRFDAHLNCRYVC